MKRWEDRGKECSCKLFLRWGDAPGLQQPADDGCVSGQLSIPSSNKQAVMAKVPGSQTQSSLYNIFKEHRGVGLHMT